MFTPEGKKGSMGKKTFTQITRVCRLSRHKQTKKKKKITTRGVSGFCFTSFCFRGKNSSSSKLCRRLQKSQRAVSTNKSKNNIHPPNQYINVSSQFIRGFCHLYDGQEAIIVGIEAALTWNDSIVTSYRDHCTHLGRGGNVKEVIAELLGKAPGCSKGNGGSMHMYRKETNFYGGNGIVGAQVPLGAGLAFGHKYRNDNCVAITMYGDGAANQGQIFEAMNMAALWDLPCIFVCENNHYGMGTAEWRSAKSPEYYKRGDYIPGIKIDGMDCLSVKQGFAFAKEFALKNGPIIVEADTYRYHGHSMSDPGSTYRTRDEISGVRQERDPVDRMRKLLIDVVGTSPDQIKAWEKELRKEVDDAVEFAKNAPLPPDAQLYENIYVDGKGIEARGVEISNVNVLG